MEPLVIIVAATVIVSAIALHFLAARRRREALAALAGRLGLSFHPDEDPGVAERLGFLRRLDTGRDRYAYNRLSGRHQGHEVMAFDFHYKTGSGKHTHHHHFTVLTLVLPRAYPELLITPEGIFSKIAQSLGYDDIDFESAEFSSAFCVRSPDRKFAYDVCHGQMMEYLLARRDLAIEFDGNILALAFDRCLDVEEFEPRLQQLVEIRRLMPAYLLANP
ncbi:MAG TPA: DUF3137 domain-containing protein [Lacunisphaera sp.]|nr:DUF3137 domain-containing protein [Lacunisphaera sp.]